MGHSSQWTEWGEWWLMDDALRNLVDRYGLCPDCGSPQKGYVWVDNGSNFTMDVQCLRDRFRRMVTLLRIMRDNGALRDLDEHDTDPDAPVSDGWLSVMLTLESLVDG